MRGLSKVTTAAVIAAVVVSASAPASVRTLRSNNFKAFDGGVRCGVNLKPLGGMSCFSAGLPSRDLDGFIALKSRGEAVLGERGDSPWRSGRPWRLEAGDRWRRAGVACEVAQAKRPNVIRCLNLDRHGFLLGRNGYKLIIPR